MLKSPRKVKLVLQDSPIEVTYRIASITGSLWVSTSNGQYRVGQTLSEMEAQQLTESRMYLVTVVPR